MAVHVYQDNYLSYKHPSQMWLCMYVQITISHTNIHPRCGCACMSRYLSLIQTSIPDVVVHVYQDNYLSYKHPSQMWPCMYVKSTIFHTNIHPRCGCACMSRVVSFIQTSIPDVAVHVYQDNYLSYKHPSQMWLCMYVKSTIFHTNIHYIHVYYVFKCFKCSLVAEENKSRNGK